MWKRKSALENNVDTSYNGKKHKRGESPMRIAICDDEHLARENIKDILGASEELPADTIIQEATNGGELYKKHKDNPFDIIFLDIEMGAVSGVETAQFIRSIDKDAIIIFITSHRQFVFESFTVEAFDYIVKPISVEKIKEVLGRALRKHRDLHHIIKISWEGTTYALDTNEIVLIEAYFGRIIFRTKDEVHECNGRLDKYQSDLLHYGFLRCHRNTLINMRYIRSIEERTIITSYGETVEISTRKKQSCLRAYNSYLTKYRV